MALVDLSRRGQRDETPENDNEDDGLLSVESLVQMFEESEDASTDARGASERDRDYVDNKQLTDDEIKELEARGQPGIIINRIKRNIDSLRGYELERRVDPRALPRTPAHEKDAEAVEQALRYVNESEHMDQKRSRVWDNLIVEGMGGYAVSVRDSYDGLDISISRCPWDRIFYDPHSAEPDFSDAGYLGLVRWVDQAEALKQYKDNPDAEDILSATMASTSISDTYDDKPKFKVWADRKRKRIRICQIWIKRDGVWYFAEYTKGGILKHGQSPHVTDKGESDCELIFGSAYVNRDNDRYGIVREMIGPQDEVNKRRSKALHNMSVAQTTMEEGAVKDVQEYRKEAARPDGVMILNPGMSDKVKQETRLDLAQAHLTLLQEAKAELDQIGGNMQLQGNALQGGAASGKALIASQTGGAMQSNPLMDALRHLDHRVFCAVWYRIRQYWTAEKWIRVTDDEDNIKWVGLNVDPQRVQALAATNPEMAQKVAGTVASLAELDCDIIIDDAPDGLTPQLEQFQSLVELKKVDANNEIPLKAIMLAMPNLKNKAQVMALMEKTGAPNPEQQMAKEMQIKAAMAQIKEVEASAFLKMAQAQKALSEIGGVQGGEQGPGEIEQLKTLADAKLKAAQAEQVQVETALAPVDLQQRDLQHQRDTIVALHKSKQDAEVKAEGFKTRNAARIATQPSHRGQSPGRFDI